MSDFYGTSRRRMVGEAWFWIAVVLGSLLVIAVLSFGIRWITAGPKGQLAAREQILSGDNRIQAYNHFFDLCASVQNAETAISTTMNQLKQTTDPGDKERLETNLSAQIIVRQTGINQYNVDARKSYTIGQFRSLQLPYQLPTDAYVPGKETSCIA